MVECGRIWLSHLSHVTSTDQDRCRRIQRSFRSVGFTRHVHLFSRNMSNRFSKVVVEFNFLFPCKSMSWIFFRDFILFPESRENRERWEPRFRGNGTRCAGLSEDIKHVIYFSYTGFQCCSFSLEKWTKNVMMCVSSVNAQQGEPHGLYTYEYTANISRCAQYK